jgi:hypothetical protein
MPKSEMQLVYDMTDAVHSTQSGRTHCGAKNVQWDTVDWIHFEFVRKRDETRNKYAFL